MKLADFDFDLPAAAIAQHPASPRDAARLLRVTATGLADHGIGDLPALLRPGDRLVVNDTRVLPARLFGRRGDVTLEVTLLAPLGESRWRTLVKKAKRLRPGDRVTFAADFAAEVAGKHADGSVDLIFDRGGEALRQALERHGSAPLPPYIRRDKPDPRDRDDYHTVYAAVPGAVAAPTAGLHFTEALLADLAARGIARTTVTLHVGGGTFLPVKSEDVTAHVMHAEIGQITAAAADEIAATRAAGGRIIAVGTTVLRLLETAAAETGGVAPWQGATDLFILPGRRIRTADLLLTNFHLPRSTLFMLVCAFAGTARMRAAYAHAVAAGYRFYSYGDACLLDRVDER